MAWLDDVAADRIKRERHVAELEAQRQRERQAAWKPLTPQLRNTVVRLLEEIGEAFWGHGQFTVLSSEGHWLLRSGPPEGDGGFFWQVSFNPIGSICDRPLLGILWKVRGTRQAATFTVTHGAPPNGEGRKYIETTDPSEAELRRVLRVAVKGGPATDLG